MEQEEVLLSRRIHTFEFDLTQPGAKPDKASIVNCELHVYEGAGCGRRFVFFERNDSLATYSREVLEPVALFIADKYGVEPRRLTIQEKTKNSEVYEDVKFEVLETRFGDEGKLEVTHLTSVSTRGKYTEQQMDEMIGGGVFKTPDLGKRQDIDQSEQLQKQSLPSLDVIGTRTDKDRTPDR